MEPNEPVRVPVKTRDGKLVYALIDAEDATWVSGYKWHLGNWGTAVCYRREEGKKKTRCLHRLVIDAAEGSEVTFNNGDRLDCRRINLRIASRAEIVQAGPQPAKGRYSANTSGHRGVVRSPSRSKKWWARVGFKGQYINCGTYDTREEAAAAAESKRRELGFHNYATASSRQGAEVR